MQDFKKLQVWQKSHTLTLEVYAKTASFPAAEIFGLTSQIRRASVSFAPFLRRSLASASEVEYFST
jgi:23S rRNA-intervening sequence protein